MKVALKSFSLANAFPVPAISGTGPADGAAAGAVGAAAGAWPAATGAAPTAGAGAAPAAGRGLPPPPPTTNYPTSAFPTTCGAKVLGITDPGAWA